MRTFKWLAATASLGASLFALAPQAQAYVFDPAAVHVVDYGSDYVSLRWMGIHSSYVVYRNTVDNFQTSHAIATVSGWELTDLGVQPNTQYYYWVEPKGDINTPYVASVRTYQTWANVYRNVAWSTVLIKVPQPGGNYLLGTGWWWNGRIITAFHVVRPAKSAPGHWQDNIRVAFTQKAWDAPGLKWYWATTVGANYPDDIAELELWNPSNPSATVNPPSYVQSLRVDANLPINDIPVEVIGHPEGRNVSGYRGSALLNTSDYRNRMVDIGVTAYPGNSGSPVVDHYGNVVGILHGGSVVYMGRNQMSNAHDLLAMGAWGTGFIPFTQADSNAIVGYPQTLPSNLQQ